MLCDGYPAATDSEFIF